VAHLVENLTSEISTGRVPGTVWLYEQCHAEECPLNHTKKYTLLSKRVSETKKKLLPFNKHVYSSASNDTKLYDMSMQHQDCIFLYLLVINTEKSTITELINAKAMNELYYRWQKFHLISWSVSRSIPANVYLNSAVQWMMLTHILVFDKLQGGAQR